MKTKTTFAGWKPVLLIAAALILPVTTPAWAGNGN